MTDFDYEPEDSWHPDDHIAVQIDNLLRRLDLIDGQLDLFTRGELIEQIAARVHQLQLHRGSLDGRQRLRLDQLAEDLALVRARHG